MNTTGAAAGARACASGLCVGLGLGAAAVGWTHGIRAALGSAPGADLAAASLIALGCLAGAKRDGGARALGGALAGLGLVGGIVGAWSSPVGAALARVGGSLDAGAVRTTIARALVGGVALVPLGALLGLAARRLGAALPPGRAGAATLAALAVGAAAGSASALALRVAGGPALLAHGGSAILLVAGALLAVFPPRRTEDGADAAAGVAPGVGAAAIGFGIAAFAFLAPRSFQFAFGNELPGVPVVPAALAAGLAIGVLVAAPLALFLPRIPREAAEAVALAVGGVAAVASLGRLDEHATQFLSSIEKMRDLADVVRAAFQVALGPAAMVGAGLGAGAVLLLAAAPDGVAPRIAWTRRAAGGAAIGAVAGTAFARFALGPWTIPDAIAVAALASTALAAASALAAGRRRLPGALAAAAGVALVAVAAARAPELDSRALLPEANFTAGRTGILQRGWIMLERDGANDTASVVRRGGSRRLLVNGRLEATNGLATCSGGILAHLPLTVHPSEKRVLLLGIGNGAALRSVLAHGVERVDVVERGPELVAAARTFGDAVQSALDDDRTRIHLGDPEDLVARAGRYDVVLHQGSGGWTELSSRLSTREFLEMAAERLRDDGIYCQWVPDDALTKTGFQSLLATVASVFPQVEVWAGHGSAVIVLARKTIAQHDFAAMLAAYRDPAIRAAAGAVWIEEPLSLLSHFLVADEAVRRIAARAAIHTRTHDVLGRTEAERRRVGSTVNPVPGLFALEDDLLPHLANVPETGFEAAVTNAIQTRALERTALDLEASRTGPEDTRALDTWQTALELNPRDRAIRRRLADLRSRTGIEYANKLAVAAAHSNLREAVEIDTTFAEGFANLGRHLAMTGEYDFAIAVIEHAVEMEPDNDLFALLLAQTWKRRIYYDKALPWYEKAMELNPRNVEAAIGWVDTKLTMQENPDLEEGLAVLRRYRAFEPENEDLSMRITRLSDAIAKGKAQVPPAEPPTAEPDTGGPASDSVSASAG